MVVTVAVINMKGGVGKTTLAFNLAWYVAYRRNKKVLLVDLDPQANASQYLMGVVEYRKHLDQHAPTVFDIFEQFTPTIAPRQEITPESMIKRVKRWTDGSLIDLVPSLLELSWTLKNPASKEHLLAGFLADVRDKYDLILLDCPPTESMLTVAAYLASDSVLIPVKPEFLAAIGLPLLVRSLDDFRRSHRTATVQIAGIVFNDADPSYSYAEHNQARAEVKERALQYGWPVFVNEVRHSRSYPRGARDKTAIFHTEYARSNVIDEFEAFGKEFAAKVGL